MKLIRSPARTCTPARLRGPEPAPSLCDPEPRVAASLLRSTNQSIPSAKQLSSRSVKLKLIVAVAAEGESQLRTTKPEAPGWTIIVPFRHTSGSPLVMYVTSDPVLFTPISGTSPPTLHAPGLVGLHGTLCGPYCGRSG